MTNSNSQPLHTISAELSKSGYIALGDEKLWLVPAEESDRNFIISTWVRSYLPIARKQLHLTETTYLHEHPSIPEKLWDQCLVLRDDMDGSAILGYICGNSDILHYSYVIPEIRGMKVATRMIEAMFGDKAALTVSHRWPFSWPAHWTYNPYKAMKHAKG